MKKYELIDWLTREDIEMVAVKNEVSGRYVQMILTGEREPKTEEAQNKAAQIMIDLGHMATVNMQLGLYKADALGVYLNLVNN